MYHELVTSKNKDDESDIDSESDDVIDNITGDLADASDGDNEKNNEKENISNKSPEKNANGNDDEDDNSFKPELSSSDSENDDVPHNYLFSSFFVFVLWVPFVEPDSRLIINLLDDKNKSKGIGTRKEMRKKDRDEKIMDRKADTSAAREITMDQRIEIQNIHVRQQVMSDRQRETSIVAFSIEDSMISKQLEQAERRADLRCSQYDTENLF